MTNDTRVWAEGGGGWTGDDDGVYTFHSEPDIFALFAVMSHFVIICCPHRS